MTLSQMLRPVQKSVGRLFFAGANNAVGPNAAVDASFREQQPNLQAPPVPASPSQLQPQGSPQQFAWSSTLAPPQLSLPAGYTWANSTSTAGSSANADVLGTAEQACSSSAAAASDETTSYFSAPPCDVRWPMGAVMLPIWIPEEQSQDMDAISDMKSVSASSSLTARFPSRTGASRRLRRKHQRALQYQQQLQKQEQEDWSAQWTAPMESVALAPKDAIVCYPQEQSLLPWSDQAVDTSQFTQEFLEPWCEGPQEIVTPCASSVAQLVSDLELDDDATSCSNTASMLGLELVNLKQLGDEASADGPSIIFPPTPDNSPQSHWTTPNDFQLAIVPLELPTAYTSGAFQTAASEQTALQPEKHQIVSSAAMSPPPSGEECEKALAQLCCADDTENRIAVQWAIAQAWPLAMSATGSRVVQKALDIATASEQESLTAHLEGHVLEACTSPHANFVLQKCVELVPPGQLQFIVDELRGNAITVARHRYGCRVLERVIEHCFPWQTEHIVMEVLNGASQLCRHTYGNFVVQHVLEHGTAQQRHVVSDVLFSDIQRLARHRVASHVVRAALVHSAPEDRHALIAAMRANANELADLAHHHCGSFVVREMRREMTRSMGGSD